MNDEKNRIAVVGLATIFPGSVDATGFWRDILEGTDRITDVPPTHWLIEDYYDPDPSAPDKTYARRGGFVSAVDFEPMKWGVPPSTIEATDTCQLLALIVAQRVLDDAARGQFDYADRERMSVILGVTSAQELLGAMVSRLQRPVWTKALREMGLGEDEVQAACARIEAHYTPWQEATFPGVLGNVVAGRIANRLNLGGTNCVTDAACASTFGALAMGVNELRLGESDVVICGGADTMNDIFMYLCFSKTPALSKSGDCRPFSDQADGTMLGEGFGMVALKRLEDAERDGDRIYAVITGVGSSSDGKGGAVYAPVAAGQARALRRAYAKAGYGVETVELVEAHGTGTKAGDAAELEGLRTVFDESGRADRQWCALGSVKSQIGHTKAAAGAAGLIKAVLALQHRVLPPTIKVERPNPSLDLPASPFYLSTVARPWVRGGAHPRRAGVSAFGFGGSNFHVALEEYRGEGERAFRRRAAKAELVLIGGATPRAVAAEARAIAARQAPAGTLAWLARSTQEGWDPSAPARLAVVAASEADLAAKLVSAASRIEADGEPFEAPDGTAFGVGAPLGDVAFLFPGQGSQYVSMGADVAMAFDEAIGPWDQAASLEGVFDEPLQGVVFPTPVFDDAAREAQAAKLQATEWAQPAIGVTSLSYLALMEAAGVRPAAVAGHSFGEVSALAAAGVLSAADATRVAQRRGALMAEAASIPGAMVAVSASVEALRAALAPWPEGVVIANHNAPLQVVLSGPLGAIEAAERQLEGAGLRARRLSVATAFHSSVVASSTEPFARFLEGVTLSAPRCPVFGNTEAAPYPAEPGAARALLAGQLARPVRFVESIEAMWEAGIRVFVEVGPSSVLTGLVGSILEDRPHAAIALDRKGKHGLINLAIGLGRLAAAGVPMAPGALWRAFEPLEDPRASEKPKMTIPILGANHGKPYPPEDGAAGRPPPNPPRAEPIMTHIMTQYAQPTSAEPAEPSPTSAPIPSAPIPSFSPPAPVPLAPPAPPAPDAWASAYYAIQTRVIDAHAAYTQSMASAHGAFLAAQQHALSAMSSMMAGQPALPPPMAPLAWPAAPMALPAVSFAATPPPVVAPAPAVSSAAASAVVAPTAPVTAVATPTLVAPAVIAPAPSAPLPVAPAAPAIDLTALMLEVVAQKTGYPVPMLELSMDLEADLGVDSIKRVEILAEMRERVSSLPEVDPAELGKLRTLGEIVARLGEGAPAPAPSAPAPSAPAPSAPAPSAPTPATDLTALMLEVVAQKTGYPVPMLELSMDLEADLGVDSIKRVEILAEMRERVSSLPEVDPAELGKLRTLGEIVARLGEGAPAAPSAPAPSAPAPTAPTPPAVDLTALMLEVVAQKTGYPVPMLELSMDLEADLGVDSIKRVEILAEMRERVSSLPEVDPAELGKLRTLGEIVARLGESGPMPASTAAVEAPRRSAARWALALAPAPASGFALAGLLGARAIAVVDGGSGLAAPVVERLARVGIPARAAAPDAASDGVIFLGGLAELSTVPTARVPAALRVQREAFEAAKAVAARLSSGPGVFVTVQDTGGDFGLSGSARAWLGGLPGLVKTAAQEWPEAGARAIDLERGGRDAEALAAVIVEELLHGGAPRLEGASGGGAEVALRADGSRWTLISERSEVTVGRQRADARSVIVASGGARGVTAHTLIALAEASKASFVLLGRTPLDPEPDGLAGATTDAEIKRALLVAAQARGEKVTPRQLDAIASRVLGAREVRATLAAIERAGGRARYLAVDVRDAQALGAALAPIRAEWGPITGVVHGAGVIADRFIADKPLEDFDRVLGVKVEGLAALLDATADDPLALLVAFSSVAGRCGNRGQADYAMANETLNKVVAHEVARRGDLFGRSLGWGPWKGGMVTPALEQHFAKLGVPLIDLDEGARMLVDELRDGGASVELVLGGEPRPEALASSAAAPTDAWRYEVLVSREAFPAIDDHRVKGQPVLPVAIALELFARAVEASRPDLVLAGIEDLSVLRGVVLERYEAEGDRVAVRVHLISNGEGATLRLELVDAEGRVRYAARGLAARTSAAPGAPLERPGGLGAFEGPVYDGVALFHGEAFQVIVGAPQIGEGGVEATVEGAAARGWGPNGWATDPALVDGGLQLALLWTCHAGGGAALPTSVKTFRRYRRGLVEGAAKAVLVGHQRTDDKSTSDVVFLDASGVPVAELRGVTMHVLPGSRDGAAARA